MKKVLTSLLIFTIIFGLVGCSQVEKIQDTVEIGRTFNDWFQSLEGKEGILIENMIENGDEILYPTDLTIDASLKISDKKTIEVNKNSVTREELLQFIQDKDNLPEDWQLLTNYELRNPDKVVIKNKEDEEIELEDTGLGDVQDIVSLVGDKTGNSRPLYANIYLELYNTETGEKEDFTGNIKLTFTELDDEWYIQEVYLDFTKIN